jgi:carbonic anhydrase
MQIEHLRTHPSVASKLANGKIRLHGWVYKFETGQIFKYDNDEGQFIPLTTAVPYENAKTSI